MTILACIGGSGLYQIAGAEVLEEHLLEGPWGCPSAPAQLLSVQGQRLWFMPRHGAGHQVPPHKINYRANLWQLKQLGVEGLIAINAVGGIHKDLGPAVFCVPDQLIDYSYGREQTYFDGSALSQRAFAQLQPRQDGQLGQGVVHVDFTQPYSPLLREKLLAAVAASGLPCMAQGVYACVQGPRLETAAEVRRLQRDGCDMVGMTAMPEAVLARELGLDYAALCLSVNWAAGLSDEPITMDAIAQILEDGVGKISALIGENLTQLVT